jgi:hypothetical protein
VSIEVVSKAFAFVLENGELTESILFATEEIPELKPEEREAIELVTPHVRDSYVDLLLACRQAFLSAAGDAKNRATLEKNKSRRDTIWERTSTDVPLLIRNAWEAWVTFALWKTAEDGNPIKLFANIRTQRRHFPLLSTFAQERNLDLRNAECSCRLGRILPKEGDSFAKLASQLAAEAWPIASELYDRITAAPPK